MSAGSLGVYGIEITERSGTFAPRTRSRSGRGFVRMPRVTYGSIAWMRYWAR